MADISDTLAALRPCPFCGSAPIIVSGAPGCHYVRCEGCGASGNDASKERAITAWNTRSGQLVPVPSVEMVARMICESGGDDPDREGPWAGWWQESAYASMATAVIAAMQEGRDG